MANQTQIDEARAAGYSDAEISAHLLSMPGVDEARAGGYSDSEILSHFGFAPLAAGWGAAPALLTGATFGQFPKIAAEGFAMAGRGDYASNLAKFESARSAYGKENPLTATGLEIAGSIPSSLAAMALVPEVAAPAMFGKFAPLASRVTTQGIRGGVAGAATSQIPQGSGTRDLAEGYAFGSALGAAFPLAGAVIAPAVAPAVASAVRAAEGLGVKLRPGQFAASRVMSKLDDLLVSPSHTDAQLKDFTRAVAGAIGETSETVTLDTLDSAAARIGQGLDDFASSARVQYSPQLGNKLGSALSEVGAQIGPKGQIIVRPGVTGGIQSQDARALANVVQDIRNQVVKNNGQIPGSLYRQMTQTGSALADLSRNSNPTVRRLGGEIADELFSAMEASSPPDKVQAFLALKDQYKNLKLLEPIVKSTGPSGIIDPKRVAKLVKAPGALGSLAKVGKFLPSPLPSGLAKDPSLVAKWAGLGALGLGGLGEAYLIEKDPVLAAQAAASATALYGLKRGAGGMLGSDWLRRAMTGSGAGLNPLVPGITATRAEER